MQTTIEIPNATPSVARPLTDDPTLHLGDGKCCVPGCDCPNFRKKDVSEWTTCKCGHPKSDHF